MFVAMVGVTVLAIVLLLCSAFLGNSGNFDEGIWPVVAVTPLLALPLAFILAIALAVVVTRRKARDSAGPATRVKSAAASRQNSRARSAKSK